MAQYAVFQLIAKVPTPALPGSGVSVISTERHSDAVGDLSAQFFRAPDCDSVVQVQVLPVREQLGTVYLIYSCPSSQEQWGVHPRIEVGTVWEFKPAVAGIDCRLLQRRRAAAKPGLAGRSVDLEDPGQAQDLCAGGFDGTGGTWSGRAPSKRHLPPMSTPGRLGIRGGVAGAEPPHKGGPNRPDRPEQQFLVVSF